VKLEIWFEFASTYSYLSISRIESLLKKAEMEYVWRPFLLGPILQDRGMETSPFVLDQLRGAYMWRDMERRAKQYNLEFTRPTVFPMNGLRAARIMTAALNEPWCGNFARSVFEAQFAHGADISNEDILRAALKECGVDPVHWLNLAQQVETKDKLRSFTDQARNIGIFGAPSFMVGGELFWGDDRLEDAIAWASVTTN
jgi:2-hydroxychromene-2-carboxylate isomerase